MINHLSIFHLTKRIIFLWSNNTTNHHKPKMSTITLTQTPQHPTPPQANQSPPITLSHPLKETAKQILRFLHKVSHQKPLLFTKPHYYNYLIDKYLKFLDLKNKSPEHTFYPSLEIEWIWFCHIIRPEKYYAFCEMKYGQVIDHDIDWFFQGEADPGLLAETDRLFREVYGEPFLVDAEEVIERLKDGFQIEYLETADVFNDWAWLPKLQEEEDFPFEESEYDGNTMIERGYTGYVDFLKEVHENDEMRSADCQRNR
eukprot:TRINITY_DN4719_c0_g1_i3.p2 TRINITY_DN4719_c0_g1~~TRINITY_DN4719_c0_g1_i3.p2  ORF type:complete len:257 (-),score=35.48 TRINITY_DN4719_c0_g1_i3:619-1389(-)